MATHQGSNQSHLVLPAYPASTEALPNETVLQHLLEAEKVNNLQTSNISVSGNHSSQLVYTGYPQLPEYQQPTADRQPTTDTLTLHPGLTNELRALQIEGGFETTSDFLHHLVVSERVKRLQSQQRMMARRNSDNCPCLSVQSTMPILVSGTSSITCVNSLSGTTTVQTSCSLDGGCQTVQLCSVNLGGSSSTDGGIHSCENGVGANCQTRTQGISVGVQVSLCSCSLEDKASDGTKEGQPRKRKEKFRSKIKRKKKCSEEEAGDKSGSRINDILVKEILQTVKSQRKKRQNSRTRRTPAYPRQRLPRDTKSAPREKQEYLCEICGATFKWRRSLIPHMWEHRNEVSVHQCPHCSTSFPYACRLKRHLIAKHPELEGGPIRCMTCGVEVQSYNTLKSHMRIHTGYKPFKCKFCPKTYKWNTGLEYHERVHTGERPYPCPHCSKAFTNKSDLTRHQTVHTGEKPHVCKKCGKGFTQSHTLKSHCKKHHPVTSLPSAVNVTTSNGVSATQKTCSPVLHTLSPSFQPQHQPTFMLGSLQDPAPANHSLEPIKFASNGGLQSLQRQVPGLPTEREIAEVVVNMLAQ
ncbi:zinc finger protein 239-like [Acanthaster planci]|uniref:Zinc finger protein 239-like n=1 Tax=Acanthaster planci TaxID=133434 RepID=A0A8B7ZCU4_ACAPL|nr:zinc finger protein 239-like [Acanthaster planci]XP_022103493.1 zinc finger protein 239-like [Acanthaster planci]